MKTVTHLNHMCMHILCFCLSSPSSPKKPITRIKMINKQRKTHFHLYMHVRLQKNYHITSQTDMLAAYFMRTIKFLN